MGLKGSKLPDARILLLGLDGAGKSTLLFKLKYGELFRTVPTVGFNVETMEAKRGGKRITLTVWDVGGQEKMRTHWRNFYQDTAGLLFAVDCRDAGRLDEAGRELERALRNEHLRGRPVVVLANKQDKEGALTATELTERFNLRKLCSDRDWYVQPCSGKTGAGLPEGFRRLAHLVKTTSDTNIKETVKHLRKTIKK